MKLLSCEIVNSGLCGPLLLLSVERGGSGAQGTRGGSGAPALSSKHMKRDDHKNSGYKPQPYTTIIPSFVSLRLYLHIKKIVSNII